MTEQKLPAVPQSRRCLLSHAAQIACCPTRHAMSALSHSSQCLLCDTADVCGAMQLVRNTADNGCPATQKTMSVRHNRHKPKLWKRLEDAAAVPFVDVTMECSETMHVLHTLRMVLVVCEVICNNLAANDLRTGSSCPMSTRVICDDCAANKKLACVCTCTYISTCR